MDRTSIRINDFSFMVMKHHERLHSFPESTGSRSKSGSRGSNFGGATLQQDFAHENSARRENFDQRRDEFQIEEAHHQDQIKPADLGRQATIEIVCDDPDLRQVREACQCNRGDVECRHREAEAMQESCIAPCAARDIQRSSDG